MAFYLSPLVDVKEIDLSTTIPAVATSIGVIVLRNTYRGQEMKKTFVTSEDELIARFGIPTNNSFVDLFAAAGYLKYGRHLYCTRVLPNDATFGGTKVDQSGTFTPYTSGDALTLSDIDNPNDPETGDPNNFHFVTIDDGSPMWMIAESRGAWGDTTKVATLDYVTQQLFIANEPTSDALSGWYPYDINGDLRDNWNSLSGGTLDPEEAAYYQMIQTDIVLQNAYQFMIFVMNRPQNQDEYQIVEQWYVSTKDGELNDNGIPMFADDIINNTSRYIRVNLNESTQIDEEWVTSTVEFQPFGGALDGTYDTAGGGVAIGTQMIALDLYDNPEEIDVSIFIDGDKPEEVKSYMISICETRKDCMSVLDCPRELVLDNRGNEVTDLLDWRKGLGYYQYSLPNLNENTSYAAVYGNWMEQFDKYNNKYRWIGTAGHVAGIYAKTDDVADPWWAPAGLNRAIITSIRRLAWNPNLGHRDLLYKNGINPIVSFAGQGKVIWGQKTMLNKPSSFNRVNVRRLFIVLEKAISTAAKYFLFEPNDEITRLQLKNMIEPFLRDVQSRRGVYDYQVICDETNNTPERIDRNELWCTILIKATRVAEFIVLQFVSLKTGASFEESAAAVNAIPDN